MATGVTVFGSDLTAKQWSDATILEMERYSNITKFIGEGPNNIIQRRTDLNAKRGQTLEFDLLKKAQGNPVINEAELAGNEEKLEFVADTVKIAEMAFAAKKYGKFEDIKSKKDLLTLMKGELSLRAREVYDNYLIRLLSGDATLDAGDSAWKGTAPTANRKLYGGDWDGGSAVDAGDDWIRVRDLSRFKTHARVTAGMRPVIVDGVETYVFLCHPYVWARIRAYDSDYKNAVLYASERGQNNPFFTGISGWLNKPSQP
jgi:N4-gp56 family major capsid protein